jgi:hypothetical protein
METTIRPKVIAMTPRPDDELRARAETRVKAREDFRIHLLVYVLVNAFLWFIWFTADRAGPGGTSVPWPAFASFGWGIGLAAHWWTVYGIDDARREAEIEKEMRRLRGDRDGPPPGG